MSSWSERVITLLGRMRDDGYVAAEYIDDAGVLMSEELLDTFARNGVMPDDKQMIKPANSLLGWSLDARSPKLSPEVLDAPWYYDHSYLQVYIIGRITDRSFIKLRREWMRVRPVFGPTFCDAGEQLLTIAETVHRHPQSYQNVPYIDLRHDETSNHLEFLACSDDFWFHVLLTDCLLPQQESIMTISFTPRLPEDLNLPPSDDENLLNSRRFR